jgi:hypothetical protein
LRLARIVASWHRPDDTAGALDCFMASAWTSVFFGDPKTAAFKVLGLN